MCLLLSLAGMLRRRRPRRWLLLVEHGTWPPAVHTCQLVGIASHHLEGVAHGNSHFQHIALQEYAAAGAEPLCDSLDELQGETGAGRV